MLKTTVILGTWRSFDPVKTKLIVQSSHKAIKAPLRASYHIKNMQQTKSETSCTNTHTKIQLLQYLTVARAGGFNYMFALGCNRSTLRPSVSKWEWTQNERERGRSEGGRAGGGWRETEREGGTDFWEEKRQDVWEVARPGWRIKEQTFHRDNRRGGERKSANNNV